MLSLCQADSESERAKWLELFPSASSVAPKSPRGPRVVPHLPLQKSVSGPTLSRTSGSPRTGGNSARRDVPKELLDGEGLEGKKRELLLSNVVLASHHF